MSRNVFDNIFSDILGAEALDGSSQVEMVLSDRQLVVRATLEATQRWIITDMFARDVLGFRAESLALLHRALLIVNDVAARTGDFSIGIDGRDMLVLSGRLCAEGLTADIYASAFQRWLEQVDLLRDTVAAIGMENFSLTYSVPDDGLAEERRA